MSSAAKTVVVACPTCSAAVRWTADNRWRPFCSERCKLIDLGQWAAEKYRVPAEEQEPEDEFPQPQ
ncbi:MAG: DNA gyrase inhibitor YacG [Thiobacillus sp.]